MIQDLSSRVLCKCLPNFCGVEVRLTIRGIPGRNGSIGYAYPSDGIFAAFPAVAQTRAAASWHP